MSLFEIKYFICLTMIIELMASYIILCTTYSEYKKKRIKIGKVICCYTATIIVFFVTLAIAVFF